MENQEIKKTRKINIKDAALKIGCAVGGVGTAVSLCSLGMDSVSAVATGTVIRITEHGVYEALSDIQDGDTQMLCTIGASGITGAITAGIATGGDPIATITGAAVGTVGLIPTSIGAVVGAGFCNGVANIVEGVREIWQGEEREI